MENLIISLEKYNELNFYRSLSKEDKEKYDEENL